MAALFGACVFERVGGVEESSVFTDPDTDLAAIGILGDFWVDVRGDHQDTHNIRRVVRDHPIALRAVRQREHITLMQLPRPIWRCDRRSPSQHDEKFVAGVVEVTPVIASWVDLPNRRAKPVACSYESPSADSTPVWNVVPDVDGVGHPTFILAGTSQGGVTTSPWAVFGNVTRARRLLPLSVGPWASLDGAGSGCHHGTVLRTAVIAASVLLVMTLSAAASDAALTRSVTIRVVVQPVTRSI